MATLHRILPDLDTVERLDDAALAELLERAMDALVRAQQVVVKVQATMYRRSMTAEARAGATGKALLSVREVRRLLNPPDGEGFSADWVYRHAAELGVEIHGRKKLFRRSAVVRYVQRRSTDLEVSS